MTLDWSVHAMKADNRVVELALIEGIPSIEHPTVLAMDRPRGPLSANKMDVNRPHRSTAERNR